MGNKTNPTGFRTGISKNWSSIWFSEKKSLATSVIEDKKIRDFLMKRLERAGIEKVAIERSIGDIKITVFVSKPGMVIGKGGTEITLVKEQLKKYTNSKIEFMAEEVRNPETSAYLVAKGIAEQIERRMHYRRSVKIAISKCMEKRARGIRIQVAGLLSGASSIGRTEKYSQGSVPTQTLRANIDYAEVQARPQYGSIGIKVWIYKEEDVKS